MLYLDKIHEKNQKKKKKKKKKERKIQKAEAKTNYFIS
jgi:hypothetical protein